MVNEQIMACKTKTTQFFFYNSFLINERFMRRKLSMSSFPIPEGLLRLDYHHTLPRAHPNQSRDSQASVIVLCVNIIHSFQGNCSYSLALKSGKGILSFLAVKRLKILKTVEAFISRKV